MEAEKKYLVCSFYGGANNKIVAEFSSYDNALKFIELLDKKENKKDIFYRIKEKNGTKKLWLNSETTAWA